MPNFAEEPNIIFDTSKILLVFIQSPADPWCVPAVGDGGARFPVPADGPGRALGGGVARRGPQPHRAARDGPGPRVPQVLAEPIPVLCLVYLDRSQSISIYLNLNPSI